MNRYGPGFFFSLTAAVPVFELWDDRIISADDMERVDVCDKICDRINLLLLFASHDDLDHSNQQRYGMVFLLIGCRFRRR